MEDCSLTEVMFKLPFQFTVPDILYYDELENDHPNLLALGLVSIELTEVTLRKSMELDRSHKKPGRYDCLALAAAIQEECMLLTGDRALTKAARKEDVETRGTIWLVEQLMVHNLIDKSQAKKAFDNMKEAGSRLPWDEVEKLLNRV